MSAETMKLPLSVCGAIIRDADGEMIAHSLPYGSETVEGDVACRRAAFVAYACNCHDGLLAACERAHALLEHLIFDEGVLLPRAGSETDEVLEELAQQVEKAKGGGA